MMHLRPSSLALVAALASLGLAGCNDQGGDPSRPDGRQSGPSRAAAVSLAADAYRHRGHWGDATPTVPQGLQVHALARDLKHPRVVYVLPNGDVLAVESSGPKAPIFRPKDLIMGLVQSYAGSDLKGANRITLLRDIGPDGIARQRTVLLENLNSPYGVVLVGHDLYVANTDALLRFPYRDGDTTITAPGTVVVALPAGPIDHHWTKSLTASPDGTKLYVGVGSNSNITENGIGAELDRAAVWEIDRATGAHRIFASGTRNPTSLAFEPQSGKIWAVANERDELGPGSRARLPYVVEGRRLLRLALQLLWPARRPARDAAAARPCRVRDPARLRAELPRGASGTRLRDRQQLDAGLPQRGLCRRARQLGSQPAERLQSGLRALRGRPPDRRSRAGYRHGLPRCRQPCPRSPRRGRGRQDGRSC